MAQDVLEIAIEKRAQLMAEIDEIMSRVEQLEDFIEMGKSLRESNIVPPAKAPKVEPLQLTQPG